MADDRFLAVEHKNLVIDQNAMADDRLSVIDDPIDDAMFPSPSTSKFKDSKTNCSYEEHKAAVEVLEQIKQKFQKSKPAERRERRERNNSRIGAIFSYPGLK